MARYIYNSIFCEQRSNLFKSEFLNARIIQTKKNKKIHNLKLETSNPQTFQNRKFFSELLQCL